MKPIGLTIVETIVSICCMTLFFCASLPAIQHCRAGSDLETCANNLRGIGVAATLYDETETMLPPYMGHPISTDDCPTNPLDYQLTYSLTQLLGLLGHMDLVEQTDPFAFSNENMTIQDAGYESFGDWLFGINKDFPGISKIAIDLSIPEFRCPTDPINIHTANAVFWGAHQTDSGFYCGRVYIRSTSYSNSSTLDLSITNYCVSAGAIAYTLDASGYSGPIQSRYALTANEIPDGATNVVLFGESLCLVNPTSSGTIQGRHSLAMGNLAVGDATQYGQKRLFGDFEYSSSVQFGSGHSNTVNFLFADGSVRGLGRNISPTLLGNICGASDGNPVFGGQ